MIIEEHNKIITERYSAYLIGLKGALGLAMHSEAPLSSAAKDSFKKSVNGILSSASTDIKNLISNAVVDSVALSYDIAIKNDYAINESTVKWELLTDAMKDAETLARNDMLAKMTLDAQIVLKEFNKFRLRVSAKVMRGDGVERHLLVGERESALGSLSFKFMNIMGKRYDASFYVGQRINYMMRSLQRDAMYYLLIAMGETTGMIINPDSSDNNKVFSLSQYEDPNSKIFHYASNGLLVKSLVTN